MIPKERQNININRLRIINNFEADFNLILKFFLPHGVARQLESEEIHGENQWGSKYHCSVEQSTLIDEILIEIHIFTCRKIPNFKMMLPYTMIGLLNTSQLYVVIAITFQTIHV